MKKISNTKGKHLNSLTANTNTAVAAVKAHNIQTAGEDESLNAKEKDLLADCEADIEKNLQGTFVLGYRLEQIRNQKLYRAKYTTFAAYCTKRWDFSKTHANRLIQAHLCEKHLKSIREVKVYVPTKESQARYICDLDPEQQVKIAHEVFETVGHREAGAGDFGDARERLYPKPKTKTQAPKTGNDAAGDTKASRDIVSFQFDTKLVSCQELYTLSVNAYNTFSNSARKNELEKALFRLKTGLKDWADWQAKQLSQKEVV